MQTKSMWHVCRVSLLLFSAFVLSEEIAAEELPIFSSEFAGIGCDDTSSCCDCISCDGMSCSDPSHQCFVAGRCASRFKLTEFNIYPSSLTDTPTRISEFSSRKKSIQPRRAGGPDTRPFDVTDRRGEGRLVLRPFSYLATAEFSAESLHPTRTRKAVAMAKRIPIS